MNSPFNNNSNNQRKNGKFSETVIMDNKFHQQLSTVRNRDVIDNHPDIELLKKEQQQASQRHLATLYRMPAIKDPAAPAPAPAPAADPATTMPMQPPRTGIISFHGCMLALEKEAKRAVKFQRPFTLMVLGFADLQKVVNAFGVIAYDKALAHIDTVMSNVVDMDIDTIGRYSNDRYLILLPECTGPNSTLVAETARQYFEGVPIAYQQNSYYLVASIGIACFPNHGQDWKELLAKADIACENVLARGGNAFGFASM